MQYFSTPCIAISIATSAELFCDWNGIAELEFKRLKLGFEQHD